MARCKKVRNLMNELRDIICEIECLKPEREACKPCPSPEYLANFLRKFSCYDPCRVLSMPCPSFHSPPRYCTTDCSKDDVDKCLLAYVCPSDVDRKRSISKRSCRVKSEPYIETQCQEICYPPCKFTCMTSAPSYYIVEPVIYVEPVMYWNIW